MEVSQSYEADTTSQRRTTHSRKFKPNRIRSLPDRTKPHLSGPAALVDAIDVLLSAHAQRPVARAPRASEEPARTASLADLANGNLRLRDLVATKPEAAV